MRVLHLVDPGSPGGGACTLRLLAEPLARLGDVDQDVIVIGHRGHVELAVRCGVRPVGSIAPALRRPLAARRALRRTIAERERRQGRYDVIHAWTPAVAALAQLVVPGRAIVTTATVGPTTEAFARGHLAVLRRGRQPLQVISESIVRECGAVGYERDLVTLAPPGLTPVNADENARATLRRRWGAHDDTLVIGAPSQPLRWRDVRQAVEVAARVAYTGRDLRLVVHHGAARRVSAARWLAGQSFEHLLVIEDALAEPWRVVAGLDTVICLGGELTASDLSMAGAPWSVMAGVGRRLRPLPGVLPTLWSMSAGAVPVVEAIDAAADIVEDGVDGMIVPPGDVNAAADRLGRLHDEPTLRRTLGARARSTVRQRFAPGAFCAQLRERYEGPRAGDYSATGAPIAAS
jgi:glycosyltransferase involved in cell wall biosynthesis